MYYMYIFVILLCYVALQLPKTLISFSLENSLDIEYSNSSPNQQCPLICYGDIIMTYLLELKNIPLEEFSFSYWHHMV